MALDATNCEICGALLDCSKDEQILNEALEKYGRDVNPNEFHAVCEQCQEVQKWATEAFGPAAHLDLLPGIGVMITIVGGGSETVPAIPPPPGFGLTRLTPPPPPKTDDNAFREKLRLSGDWISI